MTPLRDIAWAKLNLTLEVLGRRADGFHELRSLVAFAGMGDTVELVPEPGGFDLRVSIRTPWLGDEAHTMPSGLVDVVAEHRHIEHHREAVGLDQPRDPDLEIEGLGADQAVGERAIGRLQRELDLVEPGLLQRDQGGFEAGAEEGLAVQIDEFGGKRQLIIWHSRAVVGLEPDTGKRLWRVDFAVQSGPRYGVRQLTLSGGGISREIAPGKDGEFPANHLCRELFQERRDAEKAGVIDFAARLDKGARIFGGNGGSHNE